MGEIVVTRDGVEVERRELSESPLVVGCDSGCGLVLNENGVCQRQVQFLRHGAACVMESLAPSWMTLVNNAPAPERHPLTPADEIRIGPFTVHYEDAPDLVPPARIPPAPTEELPVEPAAETGEHDYALAGDEDEEDTDFSARLETSGAGLLVGEFVAADTGEDIEFCGGGSGCEPLDAPAELRAALDRRLQLLAELEALDEERKAALETAGLPEQAAAEFRRQLREAQQFLPADKACALLEKLEAKLAALDAHSGESQPPELRRALEMAMRQWRIFISRAATEETIFSAAAPLAHQEPLYALFKTAHISADRIFGWAHYALALEATGVSLSEKSHRLRKSLEQFEEKSTSLFGKLRGMSEEQKHEKEETERKCRECGRLLGRIAREMASLEPEMAEEFWRVYEQAAVVFTQTEMPAGETRLLRCFLRYGLLGVRPWFIPRELAKHLLDDCNDHLAQWDHVMAADHPVYADEYMTFVSSGHITPSLDEDLELNGRNTPEWRADKAWRKLVHTRNAEAALRETAARLSGEIERLKREREEFELLKDKLFKGGPDYKKLNAEYGQKVQHCRVEAARHERALVRIEDKYLPAVAETKEDAKAKLAESECKLNRKEMVRREVRGIRRVCRLCANLKEKFPPFALRENYKPGSDAVNGRAKMLEELAALEKCDPTVFKDTLTPAKKQAHRLYIRHAPVVLLAPCCGFLGYAWNPRHGPEVGRLVVPVYMPRPGLREKMLHHLLSDFRWDTSKTSAGVDLMTSDTLVAAYSQVRWEYRRRAKDKREKAGIFNEENDRKNWRRHYSLYLSSAMDGGKRLFFKNIEVYEQVILKYFDLPEGVERLRK